MSAKTGPCTSCRDCPAFGASAFARLPQAEITRLDRMKSEKIYERGETFSVSGRAADQVFCMRSGSAKVTLQDRRSGRQSLVKLVAPGDMLGYRCIFSQTHFRATATALTTSVACRISKSDIFELIGHTPALGFEFLKRMGNEVASAEHHHHSFCQKNVRERLAEGLLILRKKFGRREGEDWKIDTRLTRAEISNWVGASRETVIRCLTEFSQEGLIEMRGDTLYLLDLPKLTTVSGASDIGARQPATGCLSS